MRAVHSTKTLKRCSIVVKVAILKILEGNTARDTSTLTILTRTKNGSPESGNVCKIRFMERPQEEANQESPFHVMTWKTFPSILTFLVMLSLIKAIKTFPTAMLEQ